MRREEEGEKREGGKGGFKLGGHTHHGRWDAIALFDGRAAVPEPWEVQRHNGRRRAIALLFGRAAAPGSGGMQSCHGRTSEC